MGKSKQRSIKNGKNTKFPYMTRESALSFVIQNINDKNKAYDTITLFGFTAEELLEAGATYEDVMSFGALIK